MPTFWSSLQLRWLACSLVRDIDLESQGLHLCKSHAQVSMRGMECYLLAIGPCANAPLHLLGGFSVLKPKPRLDMLQ